MWRGWRTDLERQGHHNLLEQKDVSGKVCKRFSAGGPLTDAALGSSVRSQELD